MSHAVNIKTQFKNLETLFNQFTKHGWKIDQSGKINTYGSDPRRHETHQYVARNVRPGGYDVGINLDEAGNAEFVCDFYGGSIAASLGENMTNIKKGYTLDELAKALSNEDLAYSVTEVGNSYVVTAQ